MEARSIERSCIRVCVRIYVMSLVEMALLSLSNSKSKYSSNIAFCKAALVQGGSGAVLSRRTSSKWPKTPSGQKGIREKDGKRLKVCVRKVVGPKSVPI